MSQLVLHKWLPPTLVPFAKRKPRPPSASPNPRVACVLVVDRSSSMSGDPIAQVNAGTADLARTLKADPLSAVNVEPARVTFGGSVQVDCPFAPASEFDPPALTAGGDTPLGRALMTGWQLLHERMQLYREMELEAHKPLLVLLTDGQESESWDAFRRAGEATKKLQRAGLVRFYPIGVDGADMNALASLTTGEPYKLRGMNFSALFAWLGRSLRSVSQSGPGDDFEPADPRESGIAE